MRSRAEVEYIASRLYISGIGCAIPNQCDESEMSAKEFSQFCNFCDESRAAPRVRVRMLRGLRLIRNRSVLVINARESEYTFALQEMRKTQPPQSRLEVTRRRGLLTLTLDWSNLHLTSRWESGQLINLTVPLGRSISTVIAASIGVRSL